MTRRKRQAVEETQAERDARLPIPEAVGVRDGGGPVVAWDLRATHAFLAEMGWPSDCDAECCGRSCIAPVWRGVFRHVVAPGVAGYDGQVAARWLVENPNPMIVLPGDTGGGCFEALPGWSVVDVVRAFVAEAGRR